jgi:tRNA(fMet)-specific endonuclease VapC
LTSRLSSKRFTALAAKRNSEPSGVLVYWLDTNHCSLFLAGDLRVRDRMLALDQQDVATSVVVRGELLYMAHRSDSPEDSLSVILPFLRDLTAYHVDYAVA